MATEFLNFLFSQYSEYLKIDIIFEITAVLFGFISVRYASRNSVLVYPSGMISTAIFVYLLYKWGLLGDMIINAYYFCVSIYGWYVWTRKKNNLFTPITKCSSRDFKISSIIFVFAIILIFVVYLYADKWDSLVSYVDTLTTAIFFVAMWTMANRKIESWIFWIIGDIISVPLYFYKGLTFTSFQYFVFTFIAIYGYNVWMKILNRKDQTVKE